MKYLNMNVLFVLFIINANNLWGQMPDPGSASRFSVFTGVGVFTNTGPSVVTGDVGNDSGTVDGFPPGILLGVKCEDDAISAQASVDVGLLYTDLFERTCSSVIGVTMGNGQTLTPGVYCTGAATTLSGNLTFDGLNLPNSIFIIQINGALASSAYTTVTLINGASSCNIFWQINGMLTLEQNTLFKGTAVVQGAVSLLTTAMVDGRILVTSGAINMASNIVSPCETALSVDLISFDARINADEKSVFLHWQTASESNSAHYMVGKSADGVIYNDLEKISAIGNSQSLTNYSFIDVEPLRGISYYRLQQCDADGSFIYSKPVMIDFNPINVELNIFPNPVSTFINIQLKTDIDTDGLLFELFSSDGKLLRSVSITNPFSVVKINDLKSGQYFYILKNSETIFKKGTLFSIL